VPRPDAYHFQQDPGRYVMVPGNARRRHVAVEQRLVALAAFSEQTPLNEVIEGERSLGLIAAGVAFQYAREAAPDASFFKLGMSHPLPLRRLRAFVDSVERAVVVEELDDVVACQSASLSRRSPAAANRRASARDVRIGRRSSSCGNSRPSWPATSAATHSA